LSELLSFLGADLPFQFEISLVGNEQNNHFGIGVVPHVFEPLHEIVERLPPSDVVAKESADAATIVGPSNRSE
jgi:hypothetical protein